MDLLREEAMALDYTPHTYFVLIHVSHIYWCTSSKTIKSCIYSPYPWPMHRSYLRAMTSSQIGKYWSLRLVFLCAPNAKKLTLGTLPMRITGNTGSPVCHGRTFPARQCPSSLPVSLPLNFPQQLHLPP